MKIIRTPLTVVLLLGAVSAYVQAQNRSFLKASIPFSFNVGRQSFPAGDYTISTVALQSHDLIQLQSSDGQRTSFALTAASYSLDPFAQTNLIFQHYGSEYFLSQIWIQGDSSGRELSLPNRAKELGKNGSTGDVTTIVASSSFSH